MSIELALYYSVFWINIDPWGRNSPDVSTVVQIPCWNHVMLKETTLGCCVNLPGGGYNIPILLLLDFFLKRLRCNQVAIVRNRNYSDLADLTSLTSSPRAATSVATRMGALPLLNWDKTNSRSVWFLSPWIAAAPKSRPKLRDSVSHMRFVEQKMMILEPGACDRKICSNRRCLS